MPSSELKIGDRIVCTAGDLIAADGEVVEGIATVDESAITGESAPVVRESGGDRSAVTGGTRVTSDRIVIRVTAEEGNSFLDRMIAMIEGARRQLTPNEIALNIVLVSLTALFIVVVLALPPWLSSTRRPPDQTGVVLTSLPVLLALIVCLIPTTIGGLLSAIGIAGIDRLMRRNVLATSAARSRPPATSTCSCSTRPARSPSATAWRPSSSRRRASTLTRWRMPRSWPRSRTRRPRAAAS